MNITKTFILIELEFSWGRQIHNNQNKCGKYMLKDDKFFVQRKSRESKLLGWSPGFKY